MAMGFSVMTWAPALRESMETPVLAMTVRSEEHTSELQSRFDLVCRLLLEKKKTWNRSASRYESSPEAWRYSVTTFAPRAALAITYGLTWIPRSRALFASRPGPPTPGGLAA